MFEEGLGLLAGPIEELAEGFNNFIDGVGDFFENLINSLGEWFDDVREFFTNIIDSLGQWFRDVIDGIVSLGNDIGLWFVGIRDKISQFAENFSDAMSVFISYLNPLSENFFLKIAFIPSQGFIPSKFNELKDVIDAKMPIIGTLTDLFDSITELRSVDSTKPTFSIELPSKWGGQTVQVINFDVIDPYVPYVKTFIRFLIWIPFIIKIYRRLPQIIY